MVTPVTSVALPSSPQRPRTMPPQIREAYFGDSLGCRRTKDLVPAAAYGPADLCHVAKYVGLHLLTFLNHDFVVNDERRSRDDEGYIGYYHYVNGVEIISIEDYVCHMLGLAATDDGEWKFTTKEERKRELVVTYCLYNVFLRQDFRIRIVVYPGRKGMANIDKLFQLVGPTKTQLFNATTIHELPPQFWDELKASQVLRVLLMGDNPGDQAVGLCSYDDFFVSQSSLQGAAFTLVRQLSRGLMAGWDPCHGAPTNCGNAGDKKTNFYRNYLVDGLVRLCELDPLGAVTQFVIDEINAEYDNGEFDWVKLQVYKHSQGPNRERVYLELIHRYLSSQPVYTTHLGLVLLEQVQFLLTKRHYRLALTLCRKCVSILPLDFDCWYTLAVCYVLNGDMGQALLMVNLLPVVIKAAPRRYDDFYVHTFTQRSGVDEAILERTFMEYFPEPEVPGCITKLWRDPFVFSPHLRHPMVGPWFQLPLVLCSVKEVASVNHNLVRLALAALARQQLCAQLLGLKIVLVLDFDRKLTWGRAYDLVSMIVAMAGWDQVMELKSQVFLGKVDKIDVVNDADVGRPQCEPWLDLLFAVLYEDLKVVMAETSQENQLRLAALWLMTGLLGWVTKQNLRELILALVTAVVGATEAGNFDYFGTVQLLEIYNEFVLLEYGDTKVDTLHDVGPRFFTNKLIVRLVLVEVYDQFVRQLERDYFSLEFVLLHLMRLALWLVRWYQFMPPFLVIRVLSKLLLRHDAMVVTTTLRVVFEQHKRQPPLTSKGWFGVSKKRPESPWLFADTDTVLAYMEGLVVWLDQLGPRSL